MRKLCSFVLVLSLLSANALGQKAQERYYLNDGSSLVGYLEIQNPGHDYVINSVSAEIVVADSMIVETQELHPDTLPKHWLNYIDQNVVGADTLDFTFCNVAEYKSGNYLFDQIKDKHFLYILDKDSNKIRFINARPQQFRIPAKRVVRIERDYSSSYKENIYDVLTLKDKSHVQGHIVEVVPNKMFIVRTADGIKHISFSQIEEEQKILATIKKTTLWDCSDFIEEVTFLENGKTSKVSGIIEKKVYDGTASAITLVVKDTPEMSIKIPINKIKQIRRIPKEKGDYVDIAQQKIERKDSTIESPSTPRFTEAKQIGSDYLVYSQEYDIQIIPNTSDKSAITISPAEEGTYLVRARKQMGGAFRFNFDEDNRIKPTIEANANKYYVTSGYYVYAKINDEGICLCQVFKVE